MPKTKMDSKKNLLEEKVVSIGRVTKVTKGDVILDFQLQLLLEIEKD